MNETLAHGAHELQPAFVLHTYAYRESSLIVEAFSREKGRVGLVARGARRPKSNLRAALLPFQPLYLSWLGKAELHTLARAEPQGGAFKPQGRALLCGFYLNELLLKLLPREDPHERLYDCYRQTLVSLSNGREEHAAALRRFEKHLLKELGYALILDRDAESGAMIDPVQRYAYFVERGPVALETAAPPGTVEVLGQTLLDLGTDQLRSAASQSQSKALMRALIGYHLGDKVLHTRKLLEELYQR